MTVNRRALAGGLAALLLVAACGGGASQAPTTAPQATATPAAETTAPTDTPAAETAAPSEGLVPSLEPGAVADLEAKLPSEVGGVKFDKSSFDGNSIPAGVPIGDSDLEKLLADNGKSLKDVRVAIATPADTTGADAGNLVMAIQIQGIDAAKLLAWATTSIGDTSATKQTIGGKEVYGSGAPGVGGAYFYVKDDVVYYVVSFGATNLAEGILQQLP